jgi:DNA-binding MarR family transcriptional regulator
MDDGGFTCASIYAVTGEGSVMSMAQSSTPASGELAQDSKIPLALVQVAKRIKAIRDSRAALLDASLFGEPAWNMLLALYIAAGERYALSISALCAESGAPASTAARAINRLLELKMVRRVPNPSDNRSAYIELAQDTLGKLTELLENARNKYLAD